MKRHAFDPIAFAFGLVFVAIAGALSFDGITIDRGWLRWVAAGVLIAVGAVMLLSSAIRSEERR